jgi:hypothetical protein
MWAENKLARFALPDEVTGSFSRALIESLDMRDWPRRFQIWATMDQGMAQRDLRLLEPYCQPSGDDPRIPQIVSVLRARTAHRTEDDLGGEFRARVMGRDLAAYPIDVILWACDEWVNQGGEGRWFPAWSDLRELCEERLALRLRLRKAIQWIAAGPPADIIAQDRATLAKANHPGMR